MTSRQERGQRVNIRVHPTHHDGYRPDRAVWGVVIGLAGVFLCVFVAMVHPRESLVRYVLRTTGLWLGALAFVGGTIVASVIETRHKFARCPTCGRLLLRSRIDYTRSYYRCRKCDVTWTCPCNKRGR